MGGTCDGDRACAADAVVRRVVIADVGSDYTIFPGWVQDAACYERHDLAVPIASFHHSALGLQVVIEDYVHSASNSQP